MFGRSGELEVCKEVGTDMQRAFPVSPGGRSRCMVLGFRESWGTREQQGRTAWVTEGCRAGCPGSPKGPGPGLPEVLGLIRGCRGRGTPGVLGGRRGRGRSVPSRGGRGAGWAARLAGGRGGGSSPRGAARGLRVPRLGPGGDASFARSRPGTRSAAT